MKRIVVIGLLLSLLLCGCGEKTMHTVTLNLVDYTVDTQARTISDGTYSYPYSSRGISAGDYYEETVTTICYPDGGEYEHTRKDNEGTVTEEGVWIKEADLSRYAPPQELIQVLDKVDSVPKIKVDGWKLAAAVIIAALSVLELVFPGLWIRLRCMWYVEDPEPSDSGIFMSRIGSAVCLIAAFLLVVTAFSYH